MSVVNACEVTMQFMSVGFENCLSRSLVLSFWACDLSVSFYTHASISVAHLQEEEVAESGVSGRAFARSVLAHLDMPLFSYLLCFLKLCFFFFFLSLNPLALSEFQMQTDFRFNLLGLSWSQAHKSCEMIAVFLGKADQAFPGCLKDCIVM